MLLHAMLLAVACCAGQTPAKIDVVTSILPQAYIVDRVGGDNVKVSVLVGPGRSPETFEPTPSQMAAFSRAKAISSSTRSSTN